ncbi:hypothetical protein STBA_57840 [Streptomyces sp. MP131-18]|nr:hypothetical protein STBA_57840 [Streptomyces sp. MP131-18]
MRRVAMNVSTGSTKNAMRQNQVMALIDRLKLIAQTSLPPATRVTK